MSSAEGELVLTATPWWAFFIAVAETGDLIELYEWSMIIFCILVVVMATASTVITVLRMRRTHEIVRRSAGAESAQRDRIP